MCFGGDAPVLVHLPLRFEPLTLGAVGVYGAFGEVVGAAAADYQEGPAVVDGVYLGGGVSWRACGRGFGGEVLCS